MCKGLMNCHCLRNNSSIKVSTGHCPSYVGIYSSRQAKELGRKNRDLEKLLEEEERKSKQKDMLIKSLDSENQAVQLQVNFYAPCMCMNCPFLLQF